VSPPGGRSGEVVSVAAEYEPPDGARRESRARRSLRHGDVGGELDDTMVANDQSGNAATLPLEVCVGAFASALRRGGVLRAIQDGGPSLNRSPRSAMPGWRVCP
jgi:hypothetical protein